MTEWETQRGLLKVIADGVLLIAPLSDSLAIVAACTSRAATSLAEV